MNSTLPDMRYRLDLAFHGANFHGWQRQPGLRTVQGELELWLSRLIPGVDQIAVMGAGRTDAGVHAEHMVSHFDAPSLEDTHKLTERVRGVLPEDISILQLIQVPEDFHARYSATARTYVYRIDTRRTPFGRDRSWRIRRDFVLEVAQNAAERVIGIHDFSGFCRAASRKPSMTCEIHESFWERTEEGFAYHIKANRFLHGMVRLLVGTMVEISWGRWTPAHMDRILVSKDVRRCGTVAPPHGLTLARIEYPSGCGPSPDFD